MIPMTQKYIAIRGKFLYEEHKNRSSDSIFFIVFNPDFGYTYLVFDFLFIYESEDSICIQTTRYG